MPSPTFRNHCIEGSGSKQMPCRTGEGPLRAPGIDFWSRQALQPNHSLTLIGTAGAGFLGFAIGATIRRRRSPDAQANLPGQAQGILSEIVGLPY